MPSSTTFGSFLVYPPKPDTDYGRALRNFVLGLKQDKTMPNGVNLIRYLARRLKETGGNELLSFLADTHLVPAPRSAPLTEDTALWPAQRIAQALVAEGIGRDEVPLIEREYAVATSHLTPGPKRLWPDQHLDSLKVKRHLPVGFDGRLIVVDDVTTRGSTLLGCVLTLRSAYPEADVAGFAAARTLKEEEEMPEDGKQPAIGTITWQPGWIEREP